MLLAIFTIARRPGLGRIPLVFPDIATWESALRISSIHDRLNEVRFASGVRERVTCAFLRQFLLQTTVGSSCVRVHSQVVAHETFLAAIPSRGFDEVEVEDPAFGRPPSKEKSVRHSCFDEDVAILFQRENDRLAVIDVGYCGHHVNDRFCI